MSNNSANVAPTSSTRASHDYWMKYYIYKIPANKKAQNPGAYSPQSVSLGPYHHGEPDLQAMEEHKARALQRFRGGSIGINECCEALKNKVDELISSYQSLGEEWKGSAPAIKKFLMLMVKDGVFLYEFMRGYPDGVGWEKYDKQDPIFSVSALPNIPIIVSDILMLENQLPITVLERLIAVETGDTDREHHQEVNKLVLKFLSSAEPPCVNMISQPLGLHVLDISRKVITRKFEQMAVANLSYKTDIGVKSAINLHDVGVKFRKNEILSFNNGTLSLPSLTFDTTTEPRFLNAIAFECLHPAANNEVSSYIAFLQGLIDSPSDVQFLRSKGLIQSKIGDDQAVHGQMKTICKNVQFHPSSDMCEVRDRLNEYYTVKMGKCRRKLREWWRALRQRYLKNPWTITAVIAAAAILVFTALQTIYTIIQSKK